MTVIGRNFSPSMSNNKLYYNGFNVSIQSSTKDKIKFITPITPIYGDINLKVTVYSKSYTKKNAYKILGPVIHSVNPSSVVPEETIVITGENFIQNGGPIKVYFIKVAKYGQVIYTSNSRIDVIVPIPDKPGIIITGFEVHANFKRVVYENVIIISRK